jgi:hypothetical protein
MKANTECRSAIDLQLKMQMAYLYSESIVLLSSYWKNINCRCKRMQMRDLQMWKHCKFNSLSSIAQIQMATPTGRKSICNCFSTRPIVPRGRDEKPHRLFLPLHLFTSWRVGSTGILAARRTRSPAGPLPGRGPQLHEQETRP